MGEATKLWRMAFFVLTHYASWATWSTLQTQKQELIF